ncbi:hypothetical protein E2C01_014337 [Portunus trituberculatus]|uniref:Uncharacterized protein n=1 Tax=Portunus trituberculatus TaxID=210409 RepID=A0A5B7DJS2_PORTR|nr:hypothetical protein [Portunus trituberculatus]
MLSPASNVLINPPSTLLPCFPHSPPAPPPAYSPRLSAIKAVKEGADAGEVPSGRPFTRHHFLEPLHSSVNGCSFLVIGGRPLCICQRECGDWLARVACAYPRARGLAAAGLPLCGVLGFFTPLAAPAAFSPWDWLTDCSEPFKGA